MYLVTNRVDLFPTSKQEKEGVLVFETDSFSGQTTLFLLDKEKIKNLCYIKGEESKEPMPLFADIIYSLLERGYEGLSLNCEPNRNKIVIFSPNGGNSQVEITYHPDNKEYRVLFTPDLEGVAFDVSDTLAKLELRVVTFVFSQKPEEEVEAPVENEEQVEMGALESALSDIETKEEEEEEVEEQKDNEFPQ